MRHAILGVLSGRRLHGYDLKAVFEQELVAEGPLNFGQVYTTLDRLHRDGLVELDVVEQTQRPDRKMYSLTDAGRRELDEWLKAPSKLDLDLRNEIFLKLMLARRLPGADPLAVVGMERRSCVQRLHEVSRARHAAGPAAAMKTRLLLELAMQRLEATIRWLDFCATALAGEQAAPAPPTTTPEAPS